jgi:hypothetical protein
MPLDRRAPVSNIGIADELLIESVGPQHDQFELAGVDRMKHRAAAAYSGCAMMSWRRGSGKLHNTP